MPPRSRESAALASPTKMEWYFRSMAVVCLFCRVNQKRDLVALGVDKEDVETAVHEVFCGADHEVAEAFVVGAS